MADEGDEEEALRKVALQTAQSIYHARQRAEREVMDAKEALELKSRELDRQRELFRVTLSSIGDAVITTDTEGKVVFLNPVAEALTGWLSAEAAGQPLEKIFQIINEHTRLPVENPVATVLERGVVIGLANHTTLIAKDGKETPIEDSAAPIRDANGQIIGAVVVFHDVTERRHAEGVLRQSEVRLNLALEAGQMGAWEWVIASGKVTWSPTLEAIHGLEPGTFGGGFEDFKRDIHHEDVERVLAGIQQSIERREDYRIEYRIIKPDAAICWIETRGKLFLDTRGNPERMAGICMDVTIRKQVEQVHSRLAAVVEYSDDAIVTKTLDGVVTTWNTSAEQLFGYAAAEMIGQSIARVIPEDRLGEEREILRRLRAGEHIDHYETVRVTKHGRLIDVSLTVSPLRDSTGTIIGASKIARDISQRKHIEAELHAARDVAEAASRAKDEFLAALSHELRTPLTPVLMLAADMEQSADLPDAVRKDFAMIRKNVELETRIIDDLLDITRITHGKLALRFETVEVHGLITHALAILRADSEAKNLTVALDLKATGYHVSGDAVRLQQILWNVLKNAVKFTPPGGRIDIRSWNMEDALRIETTDSGIGMAPEDLPGIFTAFTQGRDAAVQFGGLGLGLSISALLVREHRGRIWAESAGRNQGSTFHLEFPLAPAPIPSESATPSPGPLPTRSLRILLAEDHEDSRIILQRLMTRWGHQVTVAASVAHAREAIAREKFDVLLSDIGLQDGTGYEIVAAFRENSDAPAIALSGYGMEADIARIRAAGFTEQIVKPVAGELLREMLVRLATR